MMRIKTHPYPESRHIAYLFFGAPGVTKDEIAAVQDLLMSYAAVLAPGISPEAVIVG